MKKINRIMSVFVLVVAVFAFLAPVFGDISADFPTSSGSVGAVDSAADKVWGTTTTIAQILAFAAIVFAGVRYMFASADQKADIKKQMVVLVIGAILVFAAATVVKFVQSAANTALEVTTP